jgi:hypothetical protein
MDSTTPPPASRLDGGVRWCLRAAGYVALFLGIWLALIKFPAAPATGLDPSWQMVLGYAHQHNLQFGTDLVFTYGPLGYLLASTSIGENFPQHITWQLITNALFALIFILQGCALAGWRRAVFFVFVFCFGIVYLDCAHMIVILLLGLALTRERIATFGWRSLAGAIAVFLGVLALIKFTNLLFAGFTIACATGLRAWQRRWVDAAVIAGGFALSFLGGWALWGQNPANLWRYISTSLNVSFGYNEGMALNPPDHMLALGLISALSVGAYYLLTLYRRADLPRALAVMLMAAACSYLNWKHGFIRADGHVLAHFAICLLVASSFPALLDDDGPLRRTKAAVLGLAALAALVGVYHSTPTAITDAPAIWNYHVKENVNSLKIVGDLGRNARLQFDDMRKGLTLVKTKVLAAGRSVDVLGAEQAYAVFGGFNYTPRPVFQSYYTYTDKLLKLNEDFYASPRAPQFVLQKIQPIDFRLPGGDDSLATRYLYHHYRYVMQEQDFLVWERKNPDPALDRRELLSEQTVKFGQVIRVPNLGQNPVWAEIDARPNLLGKARSFLYKPPIVQIAMTDGGGFKTTYRLITQMARAGFIANPHFTNAYNVVQFELGNPWPSLDTFSVELPPEDRKFFESGIKVRFYKLPPFPRYERPKEDVTPLAVLFRNFNRVPVSASAHVPIAVVEEDKKEILFAHPPSEITFQVNFPAKRLSGRFGLMRAAYTAPNKTDGAEFIVEWVTPDGRHTTLLSRTLQPLTVGADQGMQSFVVDLPSGGGLLNLKINPGAHNDIAFDWAYWTDVNFE